MITLPNDVLDFMRKHVRQCNDRLAYDLSIFPNTHEESLDLTLISHFASRQGPIRFGSGWTLRFDAHYIGGGRHIRNWEVADLGLMVMFRKGGKILRSKLAFLQSKKLFASLVKYQPVDPYYRAGMGRLLVSETEHRDLIKDRILKFDENSRYKALKKESQQQEAMSTFADRFQVKIYYLLYNPITVPWSVKSPLSLLPEMAENSIGCRVIPKDKMDMMMTRLTAISPSYRDLMQSWSEYASKEDTGPGWRLEHFINDLFLGCKEGLIDDSPNFASMVSLLNQKSAPISSALSITFDYDENLIS